MTGQYQEYGGGDYVNMPLAQQVVSGHCHNGLVTHANPLLPDRLLRDKDRRSLLQRL